MNEQLLHRVRTLRGKDPYQPIGIKTAVEIARYEQSPVPTEWLFLDRLTDSPCKVQGTFGSLDITVEVTRDEETNLGEDDVTGTFTDQKSEHAIKNTHRDWGTDYYFYEPAAIRKSETVADYTKQGMSKAVARRCNASGHQAGHAR